ncbi:enoyl-CoA hydratase/carnithine racemase [Virgibacillus natechei]|uniref:Enoyl-CoA hydratase/carnithine racemase n=1 Tax=Virgibacillus natechei TaxID=1216297 RepID=A0ABS4IBA1_9BACI|nr:enoyl-CoA hydratase/isomerase family protein [Virgibacillus natechei]MBP1968207.1 enoyl-CoA hydratase/carnithine racemase [Virgibacillus natechei]UZD14522.1 enoyl-CoA hydratase/isomerase family protein [Virgibacillus natechei]
MSETVQYRIFEEGYGEICLNRPDKHNAISEKMTEAFKSRLEEAKRDAVKFLIITGEGEKFFSAGGDLNNLHGDLSPDEAFSKLYMMKEVLYEIMSFPVPTICLLNGDAIGGGCEIATACDIRIAKETSKFGFVQTNLGILPGWGGGALLYEKVNPSFALQWLMEGSIFDANYLKECGWLHTVVSKAVWDNRDELLQAYIRKSYDQMKILKSQYKKKLSNLKLSLLMDEEVRNCANLWDSEEHKKAVQQFFARKE